MFFHCSQCKNAQSANYSQMTHHLWSWWSSNTNGTSQTSYSSLSLITLKDCIQSAVINSDTVQPPNFYPEQGVAFHLPFHPGYQFQELLPTPWDLKSLFRPKEPHIHIHNITFSSSILEWVVLNTPFAQALRPHRAGPADRTFPSLQDRPEDRSMTLWHL